LSCAFFVTDCAALRESAKIRVAGRAWVAE
jgi:hypothetical protein